MKIAIVNDYLPTTGIGNYAFSLFSEYQKMKKNAEMIYLNYGKSNEMENSSKHIKMLKTPWKMPIFRQSFNWFFYFPKKIPGGYDIYHVSSQYLSKVAAYRKPCVVSCLDIIPLVMPENCPLATRLMLGKAVKHIVNAERIVTISEHTKKDVVERLGIDREKIVVTYLGFDKNVFRKTGKMQARKDLGLPLDKKIILNVGSEEPRKNIPGLMSAVFLLKKSFPGIMLVRVGERKKETEELIRNLGLGGNVLYQKNIPKEKLALFYNAADVMAFPSSYEGFGFPVLEAMSCGTPVVTTNRTSIPEVAGNACIMIDQMEADELANRIYDVLTDTKLGKTLSAMGLKQAEKFSWEKTARETMEVYERVLRR